jgi:iron-sulfur cluster repair protein YtfE (RIC family)
MLPLSFMTDIGWRAPHRRVDADGARRAILAQHVRIRELLDRARHVVASAIGDVRMTMEAHLAFEENVLLPILNDDLPLGPQRAENLAAEHRHQREMLATLHQEARTAPWVATLAAKLMFLTDWLLADMTHEEADLLTSEVVRDDGVVVDQNGG